MEYSPKDIALAAAKILSDKKGEEIEVLHIGDLTVLADYFVICTGTNSTQVRALGEEIEAKLGEMGIQPHHVEGHRGTEWILLDYSSVVIHVFYKDSRDYYNLERLWKDGEKIDLSEII